MSEHGASESPVERRRSEGARLRTIVERMADGIVIANRDGIIRFANPAAEALFGRPADDNAVVKGTKVHDGISDVASAGNKRSREHRSIR